MTISKKDREREKAAIETIEACGSKHAYTYNPDGVARRYVFETGTLGGTVIIGLTSLESYADYRKTGAPYQ